jgi:hypothetical protein
MSTLRIVPAFMVCVLLAGCGPSAGTAVPKIAEKADVIITVDGKRHACVVALLKEAQGSAIPCRDVVPFLRDELRLQSGSIYDIRTVPNVDEAELAGLGTNLKSAGYRFIGGRSDPFLTESRKDR